MRTRSMFCLMIIGALAFCLAASLPAIASDEEDVLQVAENWAKAINSSDLELMSSIHWQSPETSKFTPAKNGAFLTQGWGTIEEGWKENLEYPAGTINATLHNPHVTILGDNVAVITVYQIMTINPPAAEVQQTGQMRQTLVVQKTGGKWLIVHEHSSTLPTE